jgi:hypothetical protein
MNGRGNADWSGMTPPTPLADHARILLGRGSSGKLTTDPVRNFSLPTFHNDRLMVPRRPGDTTAQRHADRVNH